MENKLSEEILHQIKEKNIKPKSKWQFIVSDYIVWFMFCLSILLGAVSIAVILYLIKIHDWGGYALVTPSFTTFVFMSLPYFWLLIFPIFLWVSYRYLLHTKKGYRLEFAKIVLLNLVFSIFLGSIFFIVGIGKLTDDIFIERAPFYRDMMIERGGMWHKPEKGVVAGRVDRVLDKENLKLVDLKGEEWSIYYGKAVLVNEIEIDEGIMIRVIGRKNNDKGLFVAKEISSLIGNNKRISPPFPGVCFEILDFVK